MTRDQLLNLRRLYCRILIDRFRSISKWSHRGGVTLRDELKTRRSGYSIIDVDNFARDYDTEHLVETGFQSEQVADDRCKELVAERRLDEHSHRWLVVRPAWKPLSVFEGYRQWL